MIQFSNLSPKKIIIKEEIPIIELDKVQLPLIPLIPLIKKREGIREDIREGISILSSGLYSNCYIYIELLKEFNNLLVQSPAHANKFNNDEYSIIKFNNMISSYKNDLDFLNLKYDKIHLEIELNIMTSSGISKIKISDDIHYENDVLILPILYDSISDKLARLTTMKKIKILNQEVKSYTLTSLDLTKLDYTNINCSECLFKSTCKENKEVRY